MLVEMIVHTPPLPNDPDTALLKVSVSLGEETNEVDGCLLTFRLESPSIAVTYDGCEPEPNSRLGEPSIATDGSGESAYDPATTLGVVFNGGAWIMPPFDPTKSGTRFPLSGTILALIRATRPDASVRLELRGGPRDLDIVVREGAKPVDVLRKKLIKTYLRKELAGKSNTSPVVWARSTLRRRKQ